ncbi:MAG TPA: protein kinase, partial [Planctomycetota bacterium]|nr:protein kinase [Planctomycetota bacterium]
MGDASRRPEVSRDARLGRLALEWGWISSSQLKDALAEQDAQSPRRPLGSILVGRGALSDIQLSQLLEKLAPPAPSFPPFGKYDLIREIGRGAMGVVYEAEDTELHRRVAVKMLIGLSHRNPDETRPEEERFFRETQLHKSLPPHAGIVPVLEAGVIDGRRYLAMELVDGVHLGAWQKAGSVTTRQRVALLRDVALAIHHAHKHGIIHRDLKPENILVDKNHRARITDFGLAKMLGSAVQPLLTATGTTLGTPAYMSPEQITGAKDIDARADLYALGVMLYELLTGRRPFIGETPYEIMMKTVNEEAVPPSQISSIQINPVLYKNLETICLIALSKDPKDRYPSAEAFAKDLTSWLKGEDVRIVVPRKWRLWRSRRQAIRVSLGVAILVALGAAAAYVKTRPESAPIRTAATVKSETLQPG